MKTPFFFVSILFVVVISGFCAESQVLVSEHKLPGRHFQLTQVQLVDQTDKHNELVQTGNWLLHRSESTLKLKGNLFVLHDNHTNRGWIFVRQSPLPEARPVTPQTDIEIRRKKDHVMVRLFRTDDEKVDDLWQKLPYQGGLLQRTRALQDWQRSLRPDTPLHRIPNFATNTWGDRNRDSRICEDFILKEIDAAKELGADVVQIDDGWQHGRSGNSAFQSNIKTQGLTGFWDASDSFWQVDPERFPNGLKPVIEKAKNAGIEIGLWYAPDSDDDFLNWEKDAANIVALHEKYGIRHFKIDGLQVDSPAGQKRVQQLLSTLMQRSDSNILIDLDITGGDKRPGYFGAIPYGLLYVENRYIDWQNYWPHHTLRNLWELTSWVDPGRLRIEFLNNTRKQELYEGDPLAPANYPADYLFASVMAFLKYQTCRTIILNLSLH